MFHGRAHWRGCEICQCRGRVAREITFLRPVWCLLTAREMSYRRGEHMAQARFCYDRLKEVLAAGGGGIENIVDMIAFNHDARGMDASVDAWCNGIIEGMPLGDVTSYTAIAMAGLLQQGQVGAYRAIADFSDGPRIAKNMPSVHWHKERIAGAAKMSGGRLIGISGQVASDGEKNIISRGDPASQARYCFSQISGVLEKARREHGRYRRGYFFP